MDCKGSAFAGDRAPNALARWDPGKGQSPSLGVPGAKPPASKRANVSPGENFVHVAA